MSAEMSAGTAEGTKTTSRVRSQMHTGVTTSAKSQMQTTTSTSAKTSTSSTTSMRSTTALQAKSGLGVGGGPLGKIVELLGGMQSKAIAAGETQMGIFEELQSWCEKEAIELKHEIKNAKKAMIGSKAKKETAEANIELHSAKINELTTAINSAEEELAQATANRKKARANFERKEKELEDTVDTLHRAKKVLVKHLSENNASQGMVMSAALLQRGGKSAIDSNIAQVEQALASIVHANYVSLENKQLIASLLQQDARDGQEPGITQGPGQAAYKQSSTGEGGIVAIFSDLEDKAQTTLTQVRTDEQQSLSKFQLLELASDTEIKSMNEQLEETKKSRSRSEENKASSSKETAVYGEAASESEY